VASITIRRLDDKVKAKLRVRAASHGRSMEEEAREILKAGVREKIAPPGNLGTAIRRLFEPLGGVDLEIPPRQPMRTVGQTSVMRRASARLPQAIQNRGRRTEIRGPLWEG